MKKYQPGKKCQAGKENRRMYLQIVIDPMCPVCHDYLN